jgi:hypothetical protein
VGKPTSSVILGAGVAGLSMAADEFVSSFQSDTEQADLAQEKASGELT